jgi:hypothetical protein
MRGAPAGTPVFVISEVLGVPNPFWLTNWPTALYGLFATVRLFG